MALRIYNTLTGEKEPFAPLNPPKVGIYVCGVTVYDLSHVGHARAYVAFDVVVRVLRARGYAVTYLRNYTDVDDKIIRRAAELGEPPHALSERYIAEYVHDMTALGVAHADVEPKVTENIPEIVALIERLVARGLAYPSQGDVYFSVRDYPAYGRLSHRKIEDLKSGARVEPGEQKRDPLDFALWKAAKPGEPSWESPWGKGRPGWHIECSAMAERYLGPSFDIHGGGMDLIFPHHENEVAQSEGSSGVPLAKIWMHNGFVTIDQEKMSKSLGNFFTIREVTAKFMPEALRLFLLSTHYRSPINFSDQGLLEAQRRLDYFYETLSKSADLIGPQPAPENGVPGQLGVLVNEALDDDFNTPAVLGALSAPFSALNELCERPGKGAARAESQRKAALLRAEILDATAPLGLCQRDPEDYLLERHTRAAAQRGLDVSKVEALVAAREHARIAKDFARADLLRKELLELGVEIMDRPGGTSWKLT
jgi:cysteinyl-tRNA synthetase